MPKNSGMVGEIAKLVAPIQTTIYGDIFDVLATPNPINIAYSSQGSFSDCKVFNLIQLRYLNNFKV